ncbi:MAG: nucleotidyltransferase domain-containing protein [Theionarchaea archaeon]|nr:nucleotidyltransferase domain-containing protein [Theionarchaea archaeon]
MSDFWINKFKEEALPKIIEEFHPEKVILFGSRVKGEAEEESDLDVILVAETFREVHFLRRMPMVLKKIRFPKHVDYICYFPEEFERMKETSSVVMDALEKGIVLVLA